MSAVRTEIDSRLNAGGSELSNRLAAQSASVARSGEELAQQFRSASSTLSLEASQAVARVERRVAASLQSVSEAVERAKQAVTDQATAAHRSLEEALACQVQQRIAQAHRALVAEATTQASAVLERRLSTASETLSREVEQRVTGVRDTLGAILRTEVEKLQTAVATAGPRPVNDAAVDTRLNMVSQATADQVKAAELRLRSETASISKQTASVNEHLQAVAVETAANKAALNGLRSAIDGVGQRQVTAEAVRSQISLHVAPLNTRLDNVAAALEAVANSHAALDATVHVVHSTLQALQARPAGTNIPLQLQIDVQALQQSMPRLQADIAAQSDITAANLASLHGATEGVRADLTALHIHVRNEISALRATIPPAFDDTPLRREFATLHQSIATLTQSITASRGPAAQSPIIQIAGPATAQPQPPIAPQREPAARVHLDAAIDALENDEEEVDDSGETRLQEQRRLLAEAAEEDHDENWCIWHLEGWPVLNLANEGEIKRAMEDEVKLTTSSPEKLRDCVEAFHAALRQIVRLGITRDSRNMVAHSLRNAFDAHMAVNERLNGDDLWRKVVAKFEKEGNKDSFRSIMTREIFFAHKSKQGPPAAGRGRARNRGRNKAKEDPAKSDDKRPKSAEKKPTAGNGKGGAKP